MAKSHGLSLQFMQMELSGLNAEPKRNDLVGYSAEEKAWRVIIINKEGNAYMRQAKKNMQEDKMLPYSLLARGIDLDSTNTGIPLFPLIS